jgi:hypothetical protein
LFGIGGLPCDDFPLAEATGFAGGRSEEFRHQSATTFAGGLSDGFRPILSDLVSDFNQIAAFGPRGSWQIDSGLMLTVSTDPGFSTISMATGPDQPELGDECVFR